MPFVPSHPASVILAECHRAGVTGVFLLSVHASDRAYERHLVRKDIRHALTGVAGVVFQPVDGTWLATGGTDLSGEPVGLAVVVTHGLIVVTVF